MRKKLVLNNSDVSQHVHILCLYVLYDYVQRCEDTVSIELHYIN